MLGLAVLLSRRKFLIGRSFELSRCPNVPIEYRLKNHHGPEHFSPLHLVEGVFHAI
jgi:hypothetical protein